ncbi:MAG: regulatory protein [Actinomycetia bacterium]|nr:regulatory protein [Actinomycetes bacterium]
MTTEQIRFCALPPRPIPALPTGLSPDHLQALVQGRSKWVNGTVLHYYLFDRDTDGSTVQLSDGSKRFVTWVGGKDQQDVVRESFAKWKELGIGLEFREVSDRSEAEVKIGFMDGDGAWSAVGRDVLQAGLNERTMNFGWDLTTPYGHTTALHEIGHTLGMPHEHQSPFSGIEWDENAVITYLSGPPNSWSKDEIIFNVLRKLDPAEVSGSAWDPDSIMEYAFPRGLIRVPEKYQDGLRPPGTISALDAQWMLTWYPALGPQAPPELTPFQSVPLNLSAGQQADFTLTPDATRKYSIGTFGASDAVLALFENVNGELRFVAGDDDGGEDRNALLSVKLFKDRHYVVRIRLYYSAASGQTAIMYW